MQLIAEAYDLLKNVGGLNGQQLQEVFAEWNTTDELNSFLIEITANIFKYIDPETKQPLVEVIMDAAGQKGTGPLDCNECFGIGREHSDNYCCCECQNHVFLQSRAHQSFPRSLTGPSWQVSRRY